MVAATRVVPGPTPRRAMPPRDTEVGEVAAPAPMEICRLPAGPARVTSSATLESVHATVTTSGGAPGRRTCGEAMKLFPTSARPTRAQKVF